MDSLKDYPKTYEAFTELQNIQLDTFCKKMLDYGPGNIAMGTKLETESEINFALLALAIRMNDKVQRLLNLLRRDIKPKNEPIFDTFDDLAVYATIGRIVMSGEWGK